jgi:hypothetical protein
MKPAGSARHPISIGEREDFGARFAENAHDAEKSDPSSQGEDSGAG